MSRLHPELAAMARKAGATVVATSTAFGPLLFRGPVSAEAAMDLYDRLPAGRPDAPSWIEWHAVPEVYGV